MNTFLKAVSSAVKTPIKALVRLGGGEAQNVPLPLSPDEQRRAEADERNKASMARFQQTVATDLYEPRQRKETFWGGWILMVSLVVILSYFGHWLLGSLGMILVLVGFGIRKIPTVNNGLLYMLGRRTEIGFWEGFVWIPWFLGGRLKILSVEQFAFDIARENNWTTDKWHLVYDIVFRFGVIRVARKSFWNNFFWFFHCWLKTSYYYEVCDSGQDMGLGLYQFVENADAANALAQTIAHAKEATRETIRDLKATDIFRFDGNQAVVDPEKLRRIQQDLEQLITNRLNPLIRNIGIYTSNFALADIDFDNEAAAAMQKTQIDPMLAKAQGLAYDELLKIGQKLVLDKAIGEATLRVEVIRALQKAANSGLLGLLLQGTTLEKFADISELSEIPVAGQSPE